MKYLKISGTFILIMLLIAAILISSSSGKKINFDPGPEFEYEGFDKVKNGQYERYREYITLKDSTQIAVTYFVPEIETQKEFPSVLLYSPYSSSYVVQEVSWIDFMLRKYNRGLWGPVVDNISYETLNALTSNGYTVIMADMRGTGSSTGYSGFFDPSIISDAEEILSWVASQSWSNKKIGMMGGSYLGWSQFAAASTKSPYLKCIAPDLIFSNFYEDVVRPGGIFAQEVNTQYSKRTPERLNRNLWSDLNGSPSFPSEPVIDEDGDGNRYDDIPILVKNDSNSFSGNLLYADDIERARSPYVALTKAHEHNIWPIEVVQQVEFIDDSLDYYGNKVSQTKVSVDNMLSALKQTKLPVFLTGGFFDIFSKGMVKNYANLQESNPTYLFMTPRFHVPKDVIQPYRALLDYEYSYQHQLLSLQLQFFDKYLKGFKTNLDDKPPVRIFTAFDGWKFYESWPPREAAPITYNLGRKNRLTKIPSKDSIYSYNVDFTHSSSYGYNKINPQSVHKFSDVVMRRDKHDEKCLVFETTVLDKEITVTGSPVITLNVSSNQPNADVYVYLSDVDTNGRVYYTTEGKLRAGWHKIFDNNESVDNLYDVKPELPWHSYKKDSYDAAPFLNDSVVSLKFELKPLAWKFQKGHKIRVSIAGADNINFEFNPAISIDNSIENCKPTTLNIHIGGMYSSSIELPTIN